MAVFTEEDQDRITNAIAEAEKATSGEIRVALVKNCEGSAYDKAIDSFAKMGMDKTALHNGVLILLAYEDKKFAIIGDHGINRVVPPDFWETTQVAMKAHFSKGDLVEGIIAGILLAAEKLALYFPYQGGDINELPNEIIYMDKK